jgi:hypothetical protein
LLRAGAQRTERWRPRHDIEVAEQQLAEVVSVERNRIDHVFVTAITVSQAKCFKIRDANSNTTPGGRTGYALFLFQEET